MLAFTKSTELHKSDHMKLFYIIDCTIKWLYVFDFRLDDPIKEGSVLKQVNSLIFIVNSAESTLEK